MIHDTINFELEEVFALIYRYYPKRYSFANVEYKTSAEHHKYLSIVYDANRREKLNSNILSSIAECADGYSVILREHSDYSNYPCMQYSVLLHKNRSFGDDDVDLILSLGGKRLDLELYFSLLGKYYYYSIVETIGKENTATWSFSVLSYEQLPYLERRLIDKIRSKFSSLGYKLLSSEQVHTIVPEIETELIDKGEVRIFNCLFTDMQNRYY